MKRAYSCFCLILIARRKGVSTIIALESVPFNYHGQSYSTALAMANVIMVVGQWSLVVEIVIVP